MPQKANQLLVETLANQVRLLSLDQVRLLTGGGSEESTLRQLKRQRDKGLIELKTYPCEPPGIGTEPLVVWPSGDLTSSAELATATARRWRRVANPTTIVYATAETTGRYSIHGMRRPRDSEVAHDLWVAELYLKVYRDHPRLDWRHEDGLADMLPEGGKPDAMLLDRSDDGAVPVAVEMLGKYRAEKIEQFRAYCSENEIPYEIW